MKNHWKNYWNKHWTTAKWRIGPHRLKYLLVGYIVCYLVATPVTLLFFAICHSGHHHSDAPGPGCIAFTATLALFAIVFFLQALSGIYETGELVFEEIMPAVREWIF